MKRQHAYFDHFLEGIKKRKEEGTSQPTPKLILHNCVRDEFVEFNQHVDDTVVTRHSQNMINQIPSDILLDCMFYMDPKSLFCFIQTCQHVNNLFESIYSESVPRLRLDLLNKKRDCNSMNRLIDLFSNQNSGKLENVMMTYDQYFRVKSTSNWPSSYFHDHLKFKTVYRVGDPMIGEINGKDAEIGILREQNESDMKRSRLLPYGIFTQPDTYYITFNELVKRKCILRTELGELRYNIETVVTPDLCDSIRDLDCNIDKHVYIDSNDSSKYSEKIVRFFKHPYEMTLTDFQNRFKYEVLNDTERILIYDCCFEHNRTTSTRERFVVSGGSLLHTLVGCSFNDIDIFVINNGESMEVVNQSIKKVLLKFEEKSIGQNYNIMSSNSTINIFYNSCGKSSESKIQIVLLKYDTIEELLLFFDLDCCKIAHDGTRVWTVLECLRSLKYKINIISNNGNETGHGEINRNRALKYGARGFFTFVIGHFHPLYHAMHCDFIIEQLRRSIIEKYSEMMIEEESHRLPNPAVVYFVDSFPGLFGKDMVEEDNSLAYPKVFKFANYSYVEKCISKGYVSALKDYFCFRNQIESVMTEKLKSDGYEFVKQPSDLFEILPENHNFLKEKYSKPYLASKYCILNCSKCASYYYSLDLAIQKEVNGLFSQNGETVGAEWNFDPRRHLLCTSCLKSIGDDCKVKLRAFEKRNSAMEPLEKYLLLKLYDYETMKGLYSVLETELYKSFPMYSRQTVEFTLFCLLYKSNIEWENKSVRISNMRPIMDQSIVLIPRKGDNIKKSELSKTLIAELQSDSPTEDLIYSIIFENPGISFHELSLLYPYDSLIVAMTLLFEQNRVEYYGEDCHSYQVVPLTYLSNSE